jgi:hypothetical protein
VIAKAEWAALAVAAHMSLSRKARAQDFLATFAVLLVRMLHKQKNSWIFSIGPRPVLSAVRAQRCMVDPPKSSSIFWYYLAYLTDPIVFELRGNVPNSTFCEISQVEQINLRS